MEITPTSVTNFRRIEEEYLKDQAENGVKGTVPKDHPTNTTWSVPPTIKN